MRSNLLSLQQIAKLQDSTQLRLSTGLKVNSAIDNPSSYYTASSLNNRAEDLSAILDSMGQSIQTIKAATEGIEKAEDLLSQMKAIAEQVNTGVYVPEKSYFEKLVGANGAVVSNAEELRAAVDSGKEEICVYGKIDLGDISTTGGLSLQENQKLVGVNYYGNFGTEGEEFSSISATSTAAKNLIDIKKTGCLVSDLNLNYENSANSGGPFAIKVQGSGITADLQNLNIKVYFLDENNTNVKGAIYSGQDTSIFIGKNINIYTEAKSPVYNIVSRGTNANVTIEKNSQIRIEGSGYGMLASLGGTINIKAESNIEIETTGPNAFYIYNQSCLNIEKNTNINIKGNKEDAIFVYANSSCMLAGNIRINNKNGIINFNGGSNNHLSITSTAQIYFTNGLFINGKDSGAGPNILDIAQGAKIAVEKNGQAKWYEVKADYNDTNTSGADKHITADNIETTMNVAETNSWKTAEEIIAVQEEKDKKEKEENTTLLNEDEVAAYQTQYNNALSQYDSLIKDSSYKGINLLQADDLKVIFNENRSSTLEVSGVDLSSDKIGMMTADWSKAKDVQNSINQVIEAKNTLRSASTKLGNYYSIITERETFTDNLINVLEEGADKLTLADMNEESANMLSLQTQQQLAINSLSLASQASQAVLRLF